LRISKKSSTFAPDLKELLIVVSKTDKFKQKKTNLFCTLNKQTNTLEKQTSRGRLFSLSKESLVLNLLTIINPTPTGAGFINSIQYLITF